MRCTITSDSLDEEQIAPARTTQVLIPPAWHSLPLWPRATVPPHGSRAHGAGAPSAVILVHNHPSGDPTPSKADITITREVANAARALGLSVIDHLVIVRSGHASFKSLGLL